ncbi:MAG: phosphoribosylanthranilate isomerase [bacterium]|nr:phosphoribosylanthranilate isomerase [bacterium]
MNKFRVKVCGMTRPGDAQLAARLGADLVGMIFYRKSARFINLSQADQIVAAIPATVGTVGVFVDEKVERILRIARRLRLGFVQLHGAESVRTVRQLQREGLKVIMSYSPRSRSDWIRVRKSGADLRLVDNRTDHAYGGTGRTFDWSMRPKERIDNLIVAGGIGVHNFREAVELFAPCALDINSTVETRPGIKSRKRLTEFFENCNKVRYGC